MIIMSTTKYRSSEHVHTQRETNWPVKKVIFSDLTEKQKVAVLQTLECCEVFSETNLFDLFLEYYSNLKSDTVLNRLVKLLRENFEEETVTEAIPMVSTATGLQKVTDFMWDDLFGKQQSMLDQCWPITYAILHYKKPLLTYMLENMGCGTDPGFAKEFAAFVNKYAPETPLAKELPVEEPCMEYIPLAPVEEIDAPNNCGMCNKCIDGGNELTEREKRFLDKLFQLMLIKAGKLLLNPDISLLGISPEEVKEHFGNNQFPEYKEYTDQLWEKRAEQLTILAEHFEY